ncbi:MAG: hypothetical protein WC178_00125 [Candidatus Paceibacterota bacterium]
MKLRDKYFYIMKLNLKNKIRFVVPALLFYATLDIFFKSFGFSIGAIIVLFLISGFSAFWITSYKYLPVVLSILLATGSVAFLLTIGQSAMQQFFIVFVSILFAITMVGLYRFFTPKEERPQADQVKLLDSGFNLNQAITMFSIFFLSSGIYGIYSVANIHSWQLLIIMFMGIYFSSFYLTKINFLKSQELELHLDYYKNRSLNFYSFLLALLMLELIWTMTFLPINQLTFGAIVLTIFFSYWNIVRGYLRGELTRRKFIGEVAFAITTTLIILLTSKLYIN